MVAPMRMNVMLRRDVIGLARNLHPALDKPELVRKTAREQIGVDVGFDESGVRWLDGFINRQRSAATDEVKAKLPNTLGCFLGECIRHTFGGNWQQHEAGPMVTINERLSVSP